MNRRLPYVIALAGLLISPSISLAAEPDQDAAPKHPVKPLLWKVEGNDLEKPSWLFGTIHLGHGPLGTLHPAVEQALDASDAVYTEIPLDMATQLGMSLHLIRKDGKTLTASIGKELTKQLVTELAAINPKFDESLFQSFKTWAVAMTLPMLEAQLSGKPALDSIVWEKASKAGKSVAGLEKPADQFGLFDEFNEDEQIMFLSETLRLMREARAENKDPLQDLVDAYISGESERLQAALEESMNTMRDGPHAELGKRLLKKIIDDRDVSMTETIHDKLTKNPGQSHFFAVGAAHYLGDTSIRARLIKHGYTVTRITE